MLHQWQVVTDSSEPLTKKKKNTQGKAANNFMKILVVVLTSYYCHRTNVPVIVTSEKLI
jgi:hypothetical protein